MQIAMRHPFERVSFSRQFLLASTLILLVAMSAIGAWLARQIEQTAVNRAALIASVYVESILAAQLHDWTKTGIVSGQTHTVLDRIFIEGPLSRKVVRFKVWNPEGKILYTSNHDQDGDIFPVTGRLAEAFAGRMQAEISDLSDADNRAERERWPRLLEVYVPVHSGPERKVTSVVEFYHSMENLDREIRSAQRQSWLLIGLCAGGIFVFLFGLVRRANDTIVDQQHDLREQLAQLRATLAENEAMRDRLKEASDHMTTMNEQALRRTAADLHDGPAQQLAFALLRFDDAKEGCIGCGQSNAQKDLGRIHDALRDSLDELRSIAGGLGVPGIDRLTLSDTLRRAVRDAQRGSESTISAEIGDELGDAPLPVKITVYRLVQEALANSRRHAPRHPPRLVARRENDTLFIEIADDGPGFDPQEASAGDRLGLAFMRERVRLIGGLFELDSAPDRGTSIRAWISLNQGGEHYV
jgi:signal transduction histidine kinase